MTFYNPTAPPDPNELQKFGESVNRNRIPYFSGIRRTIGNVRKTVGGLVGDVVGLPFAIPEIATNVLGWGIGAISGMNYKTSAITSRTRSKVREVLSGESLAA